LIMSSIASLQHYSSKTRLSSPRPLRSQTAFQPVCSPLFLIYLWSRKRHQIVLCAKCHRSDPRCSLSHNPTATPPAQLTARVPVGVLYSRCLACPANSHSPPRDCRAHFACRVGRRLRARECGGVADHQAGPFHDAPWRWVAYRYSIFTRLPFFLTSQKSCGP
jgi:hypothetical protein